MDRLRANKCDSLLRQPRGLTCRAAQMPGTTTRDITEFRSLLGTRTSHLFAVAVVIALAGRLTFALAYWVDPPLTVDQTEYLMLAENLRSGEGLTYGEGEHRLMRSPGYPVFLAAVLSVWDDLVTVKVAQSILGAVGVLLIAAFAYRLSGMRSALIAAFASAIYPPLVWMPAYILSETLFSLLTLSAALLLWCQLDLLSGAQESPRGGLVNWSFVGIGGLVGLAVLTRPEILLFVGLIALAFVAGRHWTALIGLLVGTLVVVAPWTASNYVRYDELIFVSSRGGPNFWLGNSALAPGDGGAGATPELREAYDALSEANAGLSPSETERVFYREAFSWIRANPVEWLILEAKKLFYFWVPIGPSYSSHSRLYWIGQATSYLVLLPFAVGGFLRIVRRRNQPIVLWALAGATLLTSLIFFPLPRYRVPIFDAVMIVCAASLARDDR